MLQPFLIVYFLKRWISFSIREFMKQSYLFFLYFYVIFGFPCQNFAFKSDFFKKTNSRIKDVNLKIKKKTLNIITILKLFRLFDLILHIPFRGCPWIRVDICNLEVDEGKTLQIRLHLRRQCCSQFLLRRPGGSNAPWKMKWRGEQVLLRLANVEMRDAGRMQLCACNCKRCFGTKIEITVTRNYSRLINACLGRELILQASFPPNSSHIVWSHKNLTIKKEMFKKRKSYICIGKLSLKRKGDYVVSCRLNSSRFNLLRQQFTVEAYSFKVDDDRITGELKFKWAKPIITRPLTHYILQYLPHPPKTTPSPSSSPFYSPSPSWTTLRRLSSNETQLRVRYPIDEQRTYRLVVLDNAAGTRGTPTTLDNDEIRNCHVLACTDPLPRFTLPQFFHNDKVRCVVAQKLGLVHEPIFFQGFPKPTISWHRLDGLPSSGQLMEDVCLNIAYFSISAPTAEDTAAYKFSLCNQFGKSDLIIDLHVLD